MEHLFNHTFGHTRLVDAGGYFEEVEMPPIKGRLRPVSAQETVFQVVSGTAVSHVFYCAGDADIKADDKIYLGTTKINIKAVKNPAYMSHHLECLGVQVQ